MVEPIPDGYPRVTPYLMIDGASAAIDAGAKELQPVEDKFYGDRSGSFEDPFGHRWHVASHVEDIAPDEMEKRMSEATASAG